MNCPRCGSRMENVAHAGISVDRCPNCLGLWFDVLEAETLKSVKGAAELDLGDPEKAPAARTIRQLKCPHCETVMTRLADKDNPEVSYLKCPVCYGVWFDGGDFKRFNEHGFLDVLKRFFRRERS